MCFPFVAMVFWNMTETIYIQQMETNKPHVIKKKLKLQHMKSTLYHWDRRKWNSFFVHQQTSEMNLT